jgi:DNA repair exonuclease SbcCD nuclease subunit
MEFIAFSDLHMYKNHSKSYIIENGMTSWMHAQFKVLNQIFDYGYKYKIKDIIFGGDLFEQKNYIPQDLYNTTWNYFKYRTNLKPDDFQFDMIFNTGNHDFHSKVSSSLNPFSDIVKVITEPTDLVWEETLIRFIPYGMTNNKLTPPDGPWNNHILFTHEDIAGLTYGSTGYVSGAPLKQQIFGDWDYIFNGHIHTAQRSGKVLNMGSVMNHDFGHTTKKYFYHFKKGEIKKIEIKCPEFIILEGFSKKIREKLEEDNYNFYRIDVEPEALTDPIFKKYNIFSNIIKRKKKEFRFKKIETMEAEINKYIELSNTDLDKNKLEEIGKELTNL